MMMRSNADIIIGIDPDVKKSGLALVAERGKVVEVNAYSFPELIEYLQIIRDRFLAENMKVVVVEASWKISHNWHAHRGDTKGTVARKGNDAGHQVVRV